MPRPESHPFPLNLPPINNPKSKIESKIPESKEDAFKVLKEEVKLRTSKEYLSQTEFFVKNEMAPPVVLDNEMQKQAMRNVGFTDTQLSLDTYRNIVTSMSVEERKDIFFLKAND